MNDGKYSCPLHDVPIKYMHRYQLRRNYFFVNRADDSDKLLRHCIDPQRIKELCRDCRGTSYEYGVTREDYHLYCTKHETDYRAFDSFLNLNDEYEKKYVEEQFIIGFDLAAEYKKKIEGECEKDDD